MCFIVWTLLIIFILFSLAPFILLILLFLLYRLHLKAVPQPFVGGLSSSSIDFFFREHPFRHYDLPYIYVVCCVHKLDFIAYVILRFPQSILIFASVRLKCLNRERLQNCYMWHPRILWLRCIEAHNMYTKFYSY